MNEEFLVTLLKVPVTPKNNQNTFKMKYNSRIF